MNVGQNGRSWTLTHLHPTPEEEWERLRDFLGLSKADKEAMLATVEPLFRRGHELVVGNYDYLLAHHETAVILGWESGADQEHLAERRRFFTVWLARTLGMDFSHDFARYLFRAGQIHAAHGPRRVHVPERYVTGAISLVQATFARFLMEEMPAHPQVPAALAGWNKALTLHLHLMLQGYQSARQWDEGDWAVTIALFGRLRPLAGWETRPMRLGGGGDMEQVLDKFFDYYPQIRAEVFQREWQQGERVDEKGTPWMTVAPIYRVKHGWRILRNGRDIAYLDGLATAVCAGDTVSFFPPGR
jgi:molybdopterin converting factor small subunit